MKSTTAEPGPQTASTLKVRSPARSRSHGEPFLIGERIPAAPAERSASYER